MYYLAGSDIDERVMLEGGEEESDGAGRGELNPESRRARAPLSWCGLVECSTNPDINSNIVTALATKPPPPPPLAFSIFFPPCLVWPPETDRIDNIRWSFNKLGDAEDTAEVAGRRRQS